MDISNKVKPKLSRHCLGTLIVNGSEKLFDGKECLGVTKSIITKNDVIILGEQLHTFPNNSFTIVFALAESHVTIHTWPERMTVQIDVFLCNYTHDNTEKCQNIYDLIIEYFAPSETDSTILNRL